MCEDPDRPRIIKTVPALQPSDLWMVELGDRVAGWLGSENLPHKHARMTSIYKRANSRTWRRLYFRQQFPEDRGCRWKRRYNSKGQAHGARLDIRQRGGRWMRYYACDYCQGYHLTGKSK